MEIAIINDIHFGVRNDSKVFLENKETFLKDVFFPELRKRNISDVVLAGDVFDRRKYINFDTLSKVRAMFFDVLYAEGINVYLTLGNHDVFFKNTNTVNSPDLLLDGYDNVSVIQQPTEIVFGDRKVMLCPWINKENHDQFMAELDSSDASILIGHFEIKGFQMHKDSIKCKNGMDREVFNKFERVYSGHFHESSGDGRISYLHATAEYTWNDYNCRRGFHVLDTDTCDVESIENPYKMHWKLIVNDDFDIKKFDYSQLTGKIVEAIIATKLDRKLLDKFQDSVNASNPHEFDLIDNLSYHLANADPGADIDAIAAEDTVTIASAYIDSVEEELTIDTGKLKDEFQTLYAEALAQLEV